MAMVSAEASCDLCLKEPLKSTERARIYSTTCTAAGISYKLIDLGNKLGSIGSNVVGVQVPSITRLVCKSCKALIKRTHQLHVDLMWNKEVLRSRLEDARDCELRGAIGSHKQGSKRLASPSFKGTGVSPASKKQQRPLVSAHSRRTLYPLLGPEEGQDFPQSCNHSNHRHDSMHSLTRNCPLTDSRRLFTGVKSVAAN